MPLIFVLGHIWLIRLPQSKSFQLKTRKTWEHTKAKVVMSYSTNEYAPFVHEPCSILLAFTQSLFHFFLCHCYFHIKYCLILPSLASPSCPAGPPMDTTGCMGSVIMYIMHHFAKGKGWLLFISCLCFMVLIGLSLMKADPWFSLWIWIWFEWDYGLIIARSSCYMLPVTLTGVIVRLSRWVDVDACSFMLVFSCWLLCL